MAGEREAVTAAEIIRNFGYWQQQALTHPITITHHGRARILLISTDEYDRLRQSADEAGGGGPAASPQRTSASLLLENMAEGFLLFDQELRIVDMNGVAEAFSGRDRGQMIGRTPSEVSPGPVPPVLMERLRRVQRTGEASLMETNSALWPDRTISVRIFPIGDQVGLLFTNVTELEQMRDSMAEWRACSDVMLAHGGVSQSRLDARARVVMADAQFAELTGFTAAELAQVKLFDIVSPVFRKRLVTAFEDMMTKREVATLDLRLMVKQGGERPVHISLAPLTKDFSAYAAMMLMTPTEQDLPVQD